MVENIVSTIVAAQQPTASTDQRNAAAHVLAQVKVWLLCFKLLKIQGSALPKFATHKFVCMFMLLL